MKFEFGDILRVMPSDPVIEGSVKAEVRVLYLYEKRDVAYVTCLRADNWAPHWGIGMVAQIDRSRWELDPEWPDNDGGSR